MGLCQVCQFIVNTDTFSPIMTMKNLVHNKLTRQNRFFAWLIQFWFLLFLTYCCHYLYPYSSYYYYRYWFYCFIIITIFYFCYSHHYYCSQYYQCCLFRVACDMYGSLFSHYRLYHHCHHYNHFIFFNNTSHWGRIQQLNSSGMVYPSHWLLWVSRRVSIIFIFIIIIFFFFFFW